MKRTKKQDRLKYDFDRELQILIRKNENNNFR